MKYPLTFYVDSLPPGVGGCANGPVIRILKKYKDDEGIYRHELEHVTQWFMFAMFAVPLGFILIRAGYAHMLPLAALPLAAHSLLYKFLHDYRLWAEVEAYNIQAQYYAEDRREMFAGFIARDYKLNVTPEVALAMMTE